MKRTYVGKEYKIENVAYTTTVNTVFTTESVNVITILLRRTE